MIFLLLLCSNLFYAEQYTLNVCVSVRNLEYGDAELFFESLLKQKGTPTVGHAWIQLMEKEGDTTVRAVTGGHSGEFGIIAPQYFSRLLSESENPENQNPVQILYQPIYDGQFEKGDGGHVPTYVASFTLTKEGFLAILELLDADGTEYPFSCWSLTEYNCVRFVQACLGKIGIVVDAACEIRVPSVTKIKGRPVRMWKDEKFSTLRVTTPEKLVEELQRLVAEGIAHQNITN